MFGRFFCHTPRPFWKVVYSIRKEFAPSGSKFFPYRVDLFSKGDKISFERVVAVSLNFTGCFLGPDKREYPRTVFDLITAHTPISAQSRNSVVFRLQPVYFFLYFFTKAYVVGTHFNCIDKSMQFKWVPTTYAFVKKVRKNCIVIIK